MLRMQDDMTEVEIDIYYQSLHLHAWSEHEVRRVLDSGLSPESPREKNRLLHHWLMLLLAGFDMERYQSDKLVLKTDARELDFKINQ